MMRNHASFGELGRVSYGDAFVIDRSTVMGRSVFDKEPVQVADLQNAGDEFPWGRELALQYGHRTILVVPLLREGRALGTILVRRLEVRPFDDKHIALLKTFADQAAIAIENARLLNELHQRTDDLSESLEQQTAISDILGVISSSPGDVKPVFDSVAEHAARICEAQIVDIIVVEDGRLHYRAPRIGELATECHRQRRLPLNRDRVMGRSMCDKQTVHVADLQSPDHDFPLGRRARAQSSATRTALAVPLIREDRALGTILVRRTEVRPFEDKHIALLKTFADQAAIAIENARLLNELRQRTDDLSESLEQQTATSRGAARSSQARRASLKPVFDAMLENATRICEAKFGTLLLSMAKACSPGTVASTLPAAFAAEKAPFRPGPSSRSRPHR